MLALLGDLQAVESSSVVLRCTGETINLELTVRLSGRGVAAAKACANGWFPWSIAPSSVLRCKAELVPRGLPPPRDVGLRTWLADGRPEDFAMWLDSLRSLEQDIEGTQKALRWQCDLAWVKGHQFGNAHGLSPRGSLHGFKNMLHHHQSDDDLVPWLHLQMNALRHDRAFVESLSKPQVRAADLGALLQEAFNLRVDPAPSMPFACVAPETLRRAFKEIAQNCRDHGDGKPAI